MSVEIMIPVKVAARFSGQKWEAICLNFDIAVQGNSLPEVEKLMNDSIIMYLESFDEIKDLTEFKTAIHRPVPKILALRIYASVISHAFMSSFGKMGKSNLSYSQYDQPCPA